MTTLLQMFAKYNYMTNRIKFERDLMLWRNEFGWNDLLKRENKLHLISRGYEWKAPIIVDKGAVGSKYPRCKIAQRLPILSPIVSLHSLPSQS